MRGRTRRPRRERLLLDSSTNSARQIVRPVVDESTGKILEQTMSSAGTVLRRVRDQTGKIIEFTLNKATNAVSNVKLP